MSIRGGVLVLVLSVPQLAHAGGDDANALVGPVLGFSYSHAHGARLVLGIEGGGGFGPERFNVGIETRDTKGFGYVEVDPWLVVGASLGFGLDEDGIPHGVGGIWEGIPLTDYPCGDGTWHHLVTLSAGIRYTGAWEFYLAPKVGASRNGCIE